MASLLFSLLLAGATVDVVPRGMYVGESNPAYSCYQNQRAICSALRGSYVGNSNS